MPSIASRTVTPESVGYSPVPASSAPPTSKPSIDFAMGSMTPNLSTTRCMLPPIIAAPDSIRQFYRGGAVPQSRFLPLPPIA